MQRIKQLSYNDSSSSQCYSSQEQQQPYLTTVKQSTQQKQKPKPKSIIKRPTPEQKENIDINKIPTGINQILKQGENTLSEQQDDQESYQYQMGMMKPVLVQQCQKKFTTTTNMQTPYSTTSPLIIQNKSTLMKDPLMWQKKQQQKAKIQQIKQQYTFKLESRPMNMNKKSDPVSLYQRTNNMWKSNAFLKANINKEGRKLDLDKKKKSTITNTKFIC